MKFHIFCENSYFLWKFEFFVKMYIFYGNSYLFCKFTFSVKIHIFCENSHFFVKIHIMATSVSKVSFVSSFSTIRKFLSGEANDFWATLISSMNVGVRSLFKYMVSEKQIEFAKSINEMNKDFQSLNTYLKFLPAATVWWSKGGLILVQK